jgi:ETFB lysine methyltransferase
MALAPFPVHVGGRTIPLTTAEDMEALIERITDEEFRKDERLPYWAELWHSALALAEYLCEHAALVRGRAVHEIGCGLGLPGIIASHMGALLTFSDYEEHALLFAELNFLECGGTGAEFLALDFRLPPARRWPVILASDVIYERRFIDPLAAFLDAVTDDNGDILLAEPDRVIAAPFFERMDALGFRRSTAARRPYLYGRHVDVSIHHLHRNISLR